MENRGEWLVGQGGKGAREETGKKKKGWGEGEERKNKKKKTQPQKKAVASRRDNAHGLVRGTSIVAIRPYALGRALGKGHAIIHADATVNSHTGTVNRGEIVVEEPDVATHSGDLAKVDRGEVVVVEPDPPLTLVMW